MNRVGLVQDPVCLLHSSGPEHIESPERLRAIEGMLARFPPRDSLVVIPARDASREEISWIHDVTLIDRLERTSGQGWVELDSDTAVTEHSWRAAVRAAGGALAAVEAVARGGLAASLALVRPPGHHAESDRAMGFCLLNNAAIAVELGLRRLGLDRVLVVDWDVHHGNGTMRSFHGTERVLFFSVHQYPCYPGTGRIEEIGAGPGRGYTVNVPLPPGQGDAEYAAVFERLLRPMALAWRPQLIVVSAGFDIARGDPLGDMNVTAAGFARMTEVLLDISATTCPGMLTFCLEGGYDTRSLADGVEAVLGTLVNGRSPKGISDIPAGTAPGPQTAAVIEAVRGALRPWWKLPDAS